MISRIDGSSYWQDGKSADGAKSYISACYQTHQHYPSWKDLQEYMSVSDVQTAVLLKEILDICQLDREAGLYYIGMLGLQCSDRKRQTVFG